MVADGKVTFTLEFKNNGAAFPAEYNVKSKALLFPKADYAKKLVGKGVVLQTIETTLNLGAGESKTVVVEKALPNMPKAGYLLGVTTNTDSSAFPSEDEGGNKMAAAASASPAARSSSRTTPAGGHAACRRARADRPDPSPAAAAGARAAEAPRSDL